MSSGALSVRYYKKFICNGSKVSTAPRSVGVQFHEDNQKTAKKNVVAV
jgi:hypothetical protein